MLITVMGALAILFLYSCARKSELELNLRQAHTRLEETRAEHQALCSQISEARDPARLRQIASARGMTYTPAAVDKLELRTDLPPEHWAISPVAGLPLSYPAGTDRPAPSVVASAPVEESRRPGHEL